MPELYRTVDVVLIVCALLCLGVGLTDWGAKGTLTAMVLLLLAPIAVGILVWLKHTEPETRSTSACGHTRSIDDVLRYIADSPSIERRTP